MVCRLRQQLGAGSEGKGHRYVIIVCSIPAGGDWTDDRRCGRDSVFQGGDEHRLPVIRPGVQHLRHFGQCGGVAAGSLEVPLDAILPKMNANAISIDQALRALERS